MATDDLLPWLAIGAMAAATWLTRYAGFWTMRWIPITPMVERFLEKMSASVLVAIVASAVAAGGERTGGAVALGCIVMLVTRSPVAAMLSGIALAAVWKFLPF